MKVTKQEAEEIFKKLVEQLNGHDTHERKQVGRCVYCVTCNVKLYQGTL